ncbi:hypothetical protein GALMADRAFT_77060 [Galerina marginata CBS 339.88]|uniref:Cytochrome P450 n=1 Tax=Galerina marginata (strain CBS 339.88) TaxID=685588 RepID=A0A067SPX4_GALM3|nr:hypothetical protein GALMADRAFT_77060 [Galerina marginata CBS 339.88]
MSPHFSVLAACLICWLLKKLTGILAGHPSPYPPGPKPKPVIGNLLDLPMTYAAQQYFAWGKKYNSGIVHASAFGNHVVVINNRDVAAELLDRRAKKYSDRPAMPIVNLMGWGYNISLARYGDAWRLRRKICQQHFRLEVAQKYHPQQIEKVHNLLQGLLDSPAEFDHHNKMLSISIPMATMFGYDVKSIDDPCIFAADQSILLGARLLLPGSSYMSFFPGLAKVPAWCPGASACKAAAEVRRLTDEMQRLPMEFVAKRLEEGTATPSLVSDFLEKKSISGASKEEEDAILSIASTVYAGGSDTTISSTGTFFYVMAINPEIQQKAQAEIDAVIGSNRLPDFGDRASLPYIEALYREILRFRPPLQLGVPHCLTEDDYYEGYFIPKGTTVLSNIWAMTHDEDAYPEPFKFSPERFLDERGKLNDDDRILAYGFGLRTCAGKHLASSTVWLIIASVLACFDIRKSQDQFGNDIEISDDYDDLGIIDHKSKFQCSFVPRSSRVRSLIADAKHPE